MRTILLPLAMLAGFAAFAIPSQDEVIPEIEFDELDAAETVAVMRKNGATDSDCLKMAEDAFRSVKIDVKTEQDAIDAAINGASKCNDKGANEIAEAKKEQKKQNKNIDSLTKELKAEKTATIKATVQAPFEDIKSSLQSKVSGASFLKDGLLKSYYAVKKKVTHLNKKLNEGKGKAKEADKSVTKAEEKAKNAKKDCQCKSYKAYQDAVEVAKKASDRHSKAWTKAAAIKCAVMSGAKKKCKTEKELVVEKKSLPQGVNEKACSAQKKPAQKKAPGRSKKLTFTKSMGGNGGRFMQTKCKGNSYIKSWSIRYGRLVKQVWGKCSDGSWLKACGGLGGRKWTGKASTRRILVRGGAIIDQFNGKGGNGGKKSVLSCRSGKIVGYMAHCASTMVHKIKLICKNV